jgi:hypothetical protein
MAHPLVEKLDLPPHFRRDVLGPLVVGAGACRCLGRRLCPWRLLCNSRLRLLRYILPFAIREERSDPSAFIREPSSPWRSCLARIFNNFSGPDPLSRESIP